MAVTLLLSADGIAHSVAPRPANGPAHSAASMTDSFARLRGGAALSAPPPILPPRRSKGLTRLLLGKSILTVLSGLPVLLFPKRILDDLGFPLLTPPHIHMTKMWGVWMCCFQALLEATFALHVGGVGRNLFVLVEGVFEAALLMEVIADRRTANAALYSAPIEGTYALTVVAFFATLINAPDPVLDVAAQRRAVRFAGLISALMLGAEAASLARGVDYGRGEAR